MEGPLALGLALLIGGAAVLALYAWQYRRHAPNRLWAISNGIESWLYGGGGLIAAAFGILVLLDHFS